MSAADPSWDDLRVLLAVHRHGSHAAAGRALTVDPTTIGRRTKELETTLGARLFTRTPAGLVATDAGAMLVARASRIEEEVLAAQREIGGRDRRLAGTVRVTAGDGFVHYVLVPALPELRRRYPDVVVELRADARALDLSRREADVAVRLTKPKEPALVTSKLGPMKFGLFASPAYLERRPPPRRALELGAHDFVGFDAEMDVLPQIRWLTKAVGAPRWVARASTTTGQALACVEGLGIALLPVFVAAREPRLVRLLPKLATPSRDAWIVVHEDVRRNARVDVVVAWLSRLSELLR